MSPSLRNRLTAARHTRFVGRDGELSFFESALRAEILPFFILHIFGPGGVGKTTLLQQFALLAERNGARPIYLDARHIDLSPDAFTRSLTTLLGQHNNASIADLLDASPQRTVILIDTYEILTPLDGWLRTTFLPQLPDTVLTVLAGRNPPDAAILCHTSSRSRRVSSHLQCLFTGRPTPCIAGTSYRAGYLPSAGSPG